MPDQLRLTTRIRLVGLIASIVAVLAIGLTVLTGNQDLAGNMYEDKLDGRITPEQFDRKAKDTGSKQQALRTKISDHQTNDTDLRAGFNMMRLTSIACREFPRQNSRERRKLLELVVGGAVWKEGQLDVAFHEPFRTLALSNSASATNKRRKPLRRLSLRNGSPKRTQIRTREWRIRAE